MNAKKLLALALAVVMVIACFAACGTNNQQQTENKEDENASATKGGEIFIGATGPLTGDASSYGISVKQGAELAVKELNEQNLLDGITFKFEIKDDQADPQQAATGFDQLMDAGMQISIGSVTSGACESFASKANAENVFAITPSASAATVIEGRDNVFRICFGDPQQGTIAADTLTKEYKKIGCIYDTSDTYSSGIYEAFDEEMKKLGVAYTAKTFDAENKKDFSAQVEALKDCDVIFLPIYYTEAGLIARACTEKGCPAYLFGTDGLDGVAKQINESVKNKISYITPFDVNSTEKFVADFVANYKAAYGAEPDQFAADGYDAIYAIFYAIKAAGVTDASISASDLCDKVVAAITASDFEVTGVTGTMSWDATGSCNKDAAIVNVN